jgi:Zn-dependent protease with chaperone function
MTNDEFGEKVRELERFAQDQPEAYRFRVLLLSWLGYGYIFLVLALALAVLLGFGYLMLASGRLNFLGLKAGLIGLAFAGAIARSLWVSFPAPEGEPLREEDAPQLFALIKETQKAISGPAVHEVLLTDELNAAISQVPRLGLFGWPKNYLLLGLPLLQALSSEQFRAVLAHEMGHLSGRHGRFSGRIYQARQTWFQLLARLEANESWGQFLFTWFFNWYAPYFFAYSFVLARRQEYEADRDAAIVVGHGALAEALINVELAAHLLNQDFYPSLLERVNQEKEAPKDAYATMFSRLRGLGQHRDARQWMRQSLSNQTTYEDTHPSLSDRLRALNRLPEQLSTAQKAAALLPAEVTETAAQRFLGVSGESFAPRLEVLWQERLQTAWREQQQQLRECGRELERLDKQAQTRPLNPEEAWQRAALTAQVRSRPEALPLVREFVAQQPENAEARFVLGRLLLEAQDLAGLEELERAMQLDINYIGAGSEEAARFLQEAGRGTEAADYRQRAERHYDQAESAIAERNGLAPHETLLPHGLETSQIEDLREQFTLHKEIATAYLAQKQLEFFPERPYYVLALKLETGWWGADQKEAEVVEHLLRWLRFPHTLNLQLLNHSEAWLGDKMRAVPTSEIYQRQ